MVSRVIVVGAGLAGLAAADALTAAGLEVILLEARDRTGGRVWSRTLEDGSVVEMGAEFVLPGNDVVVATAQRLGLGLWEKGMAYGNREVRGASAPVGPDDLRAAAAAIARALDDPDARGATAADLLDRLDIDPAVREALRARVEISAAAPATSVGADELSGVAAVSDDPSRGIAGGNHELARALAAPLDVHLNSAVTAVDWSDGRVTVRTANDTVDADAAVIAVPAPLVERIDFTPALPAAQSDALARLNYGHAAKLFVPLRARPRASAVLSVQERYWTWTARAGDDFQPVVHAFAGSQPGLDRLGIADGPEHWIDSVARLRPDLPVDGTSALLSTWSDDPWARGAYSVHTPGGNDPALAGAHGPLVFAGEYTAGPFAGLMEGALRSGLRAAEQIAAYS